MLDKPDAVDISGLDRAELLAALYNATRAYGRGALHDLGRDMTVDEARVAIAERRVEQRGLARLGMIAYFDWLCGRPIKLDIEQDSVDFYLYDNDAGPGTGKPLIISTGMASVKEIAAAVEAMSDDVQINRQALHDQLDRFLDIVCTDRPNIEDGLSYKLTFDVGVQLVEDDWVATAFAKLETMREL